MITTLSYNYLEDFTDKLRIKGRYTFSLEEIRTEFKTTEEAIKKALNRMTNKGKITPLRKGFYLIVPPEYSVQKTLPPIMFMDQMMRYLEKKYYVGLLNAASFFGASHQAPQEFFVITEKSHNLYLKKLNILIEMGKNITSNNICVIMKAKKGDNSPKFSLKRINANKRLKKL